ncbi:hypothetical protein QYE76_044451 [Lolium multiflorum]|uniref:CCHC-type domain-containing protein n=1 Tax=Lolium multiflorum TaxID=4521 RepID=A0AAD8TL51_LOLMU|nr:hypothetical protein QYE76_044451 [Lolium multiflorum]
MAAAREEGEASATASHAGAEPTLEELLKSLEIKGEEIEGLFVAKSEVEALKEETKWMAVMRVLTSKPFSATSMKKTLKFAWAPAQEVSFRDLDGGRFIVQANCLGDWKRITEQGPWIFRDHGVLVEKYDGSCRVSAVDLHRIHAWVQIHDVPELYRKRGLITGLVASIGEVLMVDMNSTGSEGGDFVRARVWLDVRKCLTRFVSFKPEGGSPVIMRVKFEKIPRFCAICGLLGHEQEECGSGEHTPAEVRFGKWLLADTPWNRGQLHGPPSQHATNNMRPNQRSETGGRGATRGGREGGGRGMRAGGRGRGAGNSTAETRKRTSADARLTEGSPVKEVALQNPPLLLEWKAPGVISEGKGVQKELDFADEGMKKSYPQPVGTPPPPPSAREQKRLKKNSTPKKDKSVTASAASGGEGRQSQ